MPPPVPTAEGALKDGVLIVVSLKSQQLFVLRDGQPYASSKVSTGRKGNETPTGEFPILQKRVHHRSNLYSNAPMPYMQRLTWDGVALHAGSLPGYAASHGCIRLPKAFAQELYKITDFTSTVVVVTDKPVASAEAARSII
jgi:lipoprotein-anchoring transpeptidase ErfK/SrfK